MINQKDLVQVIIIQGLGPGLDPIGTGTIVSMKKIPGQGQTVTITKLIPFLKKVYSEVLQGCLKKGIGGVKIVKTLILNGGWNAINVNIPKGMTGIM